MSSHLKLLQPQNQKRLIDTLFQCMYLLHVCSETAHSPCIMSEWELGMLKIPSSVSNNTYPGSTTLQCQSIHYFTISFIADTISLLLAQRSERSDVFPMSEYTLFYDFLHCRHYFLTACATFTAK